MFRGSWELWTPLLGCSARWTPLFYWKCRALTYESLCRSINVNRAVIFVPRQGSESDTVASQFCPLRTVDPGWDVSVALR